MNVNKEAVHNFLGGQLRKGRTRGEAVQGR
jgi:hypothetical protein